MMRMKLRLYKNDGNFNFTDVSYIYREFIPNRSQLPTDLASRIRTKTTDLDLYTYVATIPIHSQNKYYENQGDGTFIDKTV